MMKYEKKSFIGGLLAAVIVSAALTGCGSKGPDEVPPPPVDPPTGMSGRVYENGSVNLSWASIAQSTGYEVKLTPSGGGTEKLVPVATHYLTISPSDLEYGTSYIWSVRTLIKERTSEWSAASTFTTQDKIDNKVFLGSWHITADNIAVEASISGNNLIDLAQLLPEGSDTGEGLTFVVTEGKDENGNKVDNSVLVNMGDLEGYIPVGDFSGVPLAVNRDKTLSGWQGAAEPLEVELEEPLKLTDIPGLSESWEALFSQLEGANLPGGATIPDLNSVVIESVSFTVKSISTAAAFPDAEDTSKLKFDITMEANFGFKTTDGSMEAILGMLSGLGYDLSKMTIKVAVLSQKAA